MADGRERRLDAVEDEGEEGEEAWSERGVEGGSYHLQDLKTMHHRLSGSHHLVWYLCG